MPTIRLQSAKPIKVVSMKSGGLIKKTGTIARLHKGERVLSAKQTKQYDRDKKTLSGIRGRKHTKGRASLTHAGREDYGRKRK